MKNIDLASATDKNRLAAEQEVRNFSPVVTAEFIAPSLSHFSVCLVAAQLARVVPLLHFLYLITISKP